jgi:hypothetical protein
MLICIEDFAVTAIVPLGLLVLTTLTISIAITWFHIYNLLVSASLIFTEERISLPHKSINLRT